MATDLPTHNISMLRWIQEVHDWGDRRPGSEVDRRMVSEVQRCFEAAGLKSIELQPVPINYWEPTDWSLELKGSKLESYPIAYTHFSTTNREQGARKIFASNQVV